jgi:hypothetical protein
MQTPKLMKKLSSFKEEKNWLRSFRTPNKQRIRPSKDWRQKSRNKLVIEFLFLESLRKRDEGKSIALGTSKTNYNDPRISVAWCKMHGVRI